MEPQVIEIVQESVTSQKKWRVVSASLQALFWTSGMAAWQYFWPCRGTPHPSFAELLLPLIIAGICFGLALYFMPWRGFGFAKKSAATAARLIIEVDQIALSVKSPDDSAWRIRAVVHKGMVRSMFRVPGGIGVSERGQFGARMLGFLAIPNALPQFSELKALLDSWRVEG